MLFSKLIEVLKNGESEVISYDILSDPEILGSNLLPFIFSKFRNPKLILCPSSNALNAIDLPIPLLAPLIRIVLNF